MNPDALFLYRCQQIETLIDGAETELDLLDIAAKLRQLLFDQHSLVDAVNKSGKTIKFVVGSFILPMPPPRHGIMALMSGLDPRSPIPSPEKVLTRQQFGAYVPLYLNGHPVTVKDIIRYAANVAGGVHFDPNNSRDEYQAQKLFWPGTKLGGASPGGAHLRPIGRVALRGLSPVIEEVRSRTA